MAIDVWRTRPFSTPLARAVDRLFEDAFTPLFSAAPGNGGTTGYQTLPVNIWETDDAYHAALMAPGLDEQSINVTVHEDTLTIEGMLHFQVPEGARTVWQEFTPTRFRRSLRLGASVDPTKVEAMYRNGLLLVTMPKAEAARPRQIQVKVGDKAK